LEQHVGILGNSPDPHFVSDVNLANPTQYGQYTNNFRSGEGLWEGNENQMNGQNNVMVIEGNLGKAVLSPGAINSDQNIRAGSSMDVLVNEAPMLQSNTLVQTINDPSNANQLSPVHHNRDKTAKSIVHMENTRNSDLIVDPTIQKPAAGEDDENMSLL